MQKLELVLQHGVALLRAVKVDGLLRQNEVGVPMPHAVDAASVALGHRVEALKGLGVWGWGG